jgi:DNA-binding transcriptional LysR family regulator
MRFTLKQLAYFAAAGETLSVTLAAERLSISPPSVSAAIQQLEAELQVQLFVRHHAQGLSLTPAGERILSSAKALLSQAEEIYGVADEVATGLAGPLAVGAFPTFAPLLLPHILRRFAERYPRVRLQAMTGDQVVLLDALRRAEIAAAVTYDLEIGDEVAFETLAVLPPQVLLPADHALAGRREIALGEVVALPYVQLDMPLSRDYFASLFAAERLAPRTIATAATMDLVRGYVACGLGYSLISIVPPNDRALNGGALAAIPLAGSHRPMRCGVATLQHLRKTRLVTAFEEECRSLLADGRLPGLASP